MFPKTIDIKLESPVSDTFRCQVAANSLDIDVKKKSTHHLHVENVNVPEQWNMALIYGASGSGKTSMAETIFGKDVFKTIMDPELPIIDQLPSSMGYDECAALLNGIGLNSVPCWLRPVKTLSNGQRARAEAVLLMCQDNPVIFIDEWTSVVDRTVAKAMSLCLAKFVKRHKKQVVLLSCHYDIIEWLKPDWVIDCNTQEFHLPQSESFFFQPREEITFEIRKADKASWKYFSKYHYLSDRLPGGKVYLYGLFHGENQIGFQCFANYTPHKPNSKKIFHSNRTVVHPDYNGLGLGILLINETSRLMVEETGYRIMAKFSSTPVFKAMIKQACWKFLGEKRLMGKMKTGGGMERQAGFRDKGVRTFNFEYHGTKSDT